jgi:hypothetical protein
MSAHYTVRIDRPRSDRTWRVLALPASPNAERYPAARYDPETGILAATPAMPPALLRQLALAVQEEAARLRVAPLSNPPRKLPVLAEGDEPAPTPLLAWAQGRRSPEERGATLRRPGDPRSPFVVAYGMGVDSTAMLVALVRSGIRPGAILFADTGAEQPHTYEYLPVIQAYLKHHGFPPVTPVRYQMVRQGKHGTYSTIEQNCLVNLTVPSVAFGFQRMACSDKWKIGPQERWTEHWQPAIAAWDAGLPVVKAIGYDAGPADAKRGRDLTSDRKWLYWYPLRDLGWDRARCKAEIAAEGLRVPKKSACFLCPAQHPEELEEMVRERPRLAERIEAVEAAAGPYLAEIEGLWGTGRKGTGGTVAKPGRMTEYIESVRKGETWAPAPSPPRRLPRTKEEREREEAAEEAARKERLRAASEAHHAALEARGRIDVWPEEMMPKLAAEVAPGVPWEGPMRPKKNPAGGLEALVARAERSARAVHG